MICPCLCEAGRESGRYCRSCPKRGTHVECRGKPVASHDDEFRTSMCIEALCSTVRQWARTVTVCRPMCFCFVQALPYPWQFLHSSLPLISCTTPVDCHNRVSAQQSSYAGHNRDTYTLLTPMHLLLQLVQMRQPRQHNMLIRLLDLARQKHLIKNRIHLYTLASPFPAPQHHPPHTL